MGRLTEYLIILSITPVTFFTIISLKPSDSISFIAFKLFIVFICSYTFYRNLLKVGGTGETQR